MAQFARSGSSLLAGLLAISILVLFGYLLFIDSESIYQGETLEPPIELAEPDLPLEVIEADEPLPNRQNINREHSNAFVDRLTADNEQKYIILKENQDQFVHPDSVIALPSLERRVTTLNQLMQDKSLKDDTPITLQYIQESRERATLSEIGQREEDHFAPITIVTDDNETITAPLAELLKREDLDQTTPVIEIRRETKAIEITAAELAEMDIDPNQEVTATITHSVKELAIADLIGEDAIEAGSLLYLHRVTEADRQGLWGIIQLGLVDKFRQGMPIQGLDNRDRLSVVIPADADEPLQTGLSSFLGQILNHKVKSSYVYNFNTETMGDNPDLISPGQQLIMISFTPDELRSIYQFFAHQQPENVKSFAIN